MGLGSFFKRSKNEAEEESHIDINIDDCDGCEKCVTACLNNVLILVEDKATANNSFGCKHCHVCEAICPNDCIKVN